MFLLFSAGYGTITPQTSEGRLLCIFVSLIGIPITLLTLKSIGELVAKWTSTFVTKFERRILKRLEPKKVQTKSAVVSFLFTLLLMMGYGLLLVRYHGLTFVEGIYFLFVTTIGFGDFVFTFYELQIKQLSLNNSINYIIKDESDDAGNISVAIFEGMLFELLWLLGLCVVSSVINSILEAIEERKCHSRCFGCVARKIQKHLNNNQNKIPEEGGEITHLGMGNVGVRKETSS